MEKQDPGDGQPSVVKGGLAAWQLNRVVRHVESHIHKRLTVCDLAAVVRLSTRHFARAFRRSHGMSPRAFVMERRVEHAKKLMLSTEMPLCEIALACGACDQAHLSRLFKSACGIPPLQWRRRQTSFSGTSFHGSTSARTPVSHMITYAPDLASVLDQGVDLASVQ
jgi:transcriptional regulator GlxA family with amidase domain